MAKKATKKPAASAPEETEDTSHLKSNAPPEVNFDMMLDDLELEASNWLDDEPLSSQKQADELTRMVDAAKRLSDEIEAARKAEKEPFLEGGRAVDAKFKPLAERADKYLRKMKNKIGEWLKLVRAENERRAREAEAERREAERRLREEHERNRQSSTMADDEALEAAEKAAEEAKKEAARLAREKATASAGSTTVKLRKWWMVNILDRRELLIHYLRLQLPDFNEELEALLRKYAERDVRRNGIRQLPGCSIWSEDRPI